MDFPLPELGEGIYEAELVAWHIKPGDTVKRGQILLEALTDKATMEVPAPFAGKIDALRAEPGQAIKVGQAVLTYQATGGDSAPTREPAVATAAATRTPVIAAATAPMRNGPSRAAGDEVKAAPSVRLMARKLGIDLAAVHGSGPQGRILVDDLTRLLRESGHAFSSAHPLAASPPPVLSDLGKPGTRVKLQGVRRKIAEHMVLAKATIPHYSYVDECDVTDLVRLRESLREPMQRKGVKITYLPFFVKAVVEALKEVPAVNAALDDAAGEIVLHDKYHIGIAVAAPAGLIVPVIHDADQKDLVTIAREIDRLSNDARAGKTKLEDLRGGTFTITSIGNIGGLLATPIINHPQVGIMAVGKIVKRPRFDDHGQVRSADMVYLSFSFDHRVLDGAVGAVFGNAVIRRLQSPAALLIA